MGAHAACSLFHKPDRPNGWTIEVENKPRANSILGADITAKSEPEGDMFWTVIGAHSANPGKVSFGDTGKGATAHLTQELLKQVVGLDMIHRPNKGTVQAPPVP